MKVKITEEEVTQLSCFDDWGSNHDPEVDVDESTLERWKKTFQEFEKVQNEMQQAINKAKAS